MKFLAVLFLPIRSVVESVEYTNEWYASIAARKGIGHSSYFDRYLHFGVQPDDIPDRLVDAALLELTNEEGELFAELRDELRAKGSVVLDKILQRGPGLDDAQRAGVICGW